MTDEDIESFVEENRDIITYVLRYGDDPYARACALALLTNGGDDPDPEEIKEEVEEWL